MGAVRLGSAFDGAPHRTHGGVGAACIDETMGAPLPIIGTMAVTGTLSIRYLSPCPLHTDLEFRAWLDHRDGRKLYLRANGASTNGRVFVDAEATFIALEYSDTTRGETND